MFKLFRVTVLLTLLCVQCIEAFGQEISVKSRIRELPIDLTARKYEKTDAQGNACAVIKVELPTLPDISFTGSVGDVKQNVGEYVLYVSPGITSIDVLRGKNLVCTIDMEGVEIEAKHTYRVDLALKREKVFRVMPENAEIVVNGERIEVDSTGVGRMSCEVEVKYNYTISAPDYESINGNFMIAPEEAEVELINKRLDRKTGKVKFDCKTKSINVFAGMERMDREKGGYYKIPIGRHNMRITSEKYEDWTGELSVHEYETLKKVPVELEKPKNGVSKRLRTRYEFYASVGEYVPTSSDEDGHSDYYFNIGFAPELFLVRWLTFRPGIEYMFYGGRKFEDSEGDNYTFMNLSMPWVFSVNFPLGKYNQHHFSVGVGPIVGLGIGGYVKGWDWGDLEDLEDVDSNSCVDCLVGARVSAQLTLNHFVIGVNVDYHKYVCEKLSPSEMIVPMATIGYKF